MRCVVLLLAVLMITGCGRHGTEDFDPYYGSEGLVIEFIENAPPYELYEGQETALGITLRNDGASDITRGIVSFAIEPEYMTEPSGDDFGLFLYGRSRYIPEGEEKTKLFYFNTKYLERMSQIHNSQIIASACYEYHTLFRSDACIDPNIYNIEDVAKPCYVEDKTFSGQGSPIAVTYVKGSMSNDRDGGVVPLFEITIENLGDGEVFDYMRVNDFCSSEKIYTEDFNTILIDRAMLGEERMFCTPNPVRIKADGSAKILCKPTESLGRTATAYNTLLAIDLLYGYSTSITTDVIIQKMPA